MKLYFFSNMNIKSIAVVSLIITSSCSKKQEIETKFHVRGNCEMCKERIENTAYKITNVSYANWDEETSELKVKIDTSSSSLLELHLKIAATGHSTSLCKMDLKSHDELPDCCKENSKTMKEDNSIN